MRIFRMISVFMILATMHAVGATQERHRFEFLQYHMAVPVRIVLIAETREQAEQASEEAFASFQRLNMIMSDYEYESELMQLCRKAEESGQPIPVSDDLGRVLQKSKEFCTNFHGAFDITVSPIVKLWRRAKRIGKRPEPELLEKAQTLVGNDLWEIEPDHKTVKILKNGLRFDLGAIAKGDAIDQAVAILKKNGIQAALVDAGGDLRAFGTVPERKIKEKEDPATSWIVDLPDHGGPRGQLIINDLAVASSGDLEQHQIFDGKRYSHIIDPRTGTPLTDSGVVTVTASDATTADALASALSVLKPEEGLELLKKYPGTEALITREFDGRRQTWKSSGWNALQDLSLHRKQKKP